MDMIKTAELETRHEAVRMKRSGPRPQKLSPNDANLKMRVAESLRTAASRKALAAVDEKKMDDFERAVADLAIKGKDSRSIATSLNVPPHVVQATRRIARVHDYITRYQRKRKEIIAHAKDSVKVQAYANMLSAGEALAQAVEKIIESGTEVANLAQLLEIYKDAQDRVGFPAVKSVQSKQLNANISDSTVAKLLENNRRYHGMQVVNGGSVEVVETEETRLAFENDNQFESVDTTEEADG